MICKYAGTLPSDDLHTLKNKYKRTRSKGMAEDINKEIAGKHADEIGKKTGLSGILRRVLGNG